MGILLFELFRNPLFMGILNKWETLVILLVLQKITAKTSKLLRTFNQVPRIKGICNLHLPAETLGSLSDGKEQNSKTNQRPIIQNQLITNK